MPVDLTIDPRWLDKGPAFSEPWQAEAFALTMQLSRAGHFTWAEWVETFSSEIKASPQHDDEDVNTAYYRQWMQALEKIVAGRGMTTDAEVADYQEHWKRSYFHTEHGKPVEFRKGLAPIQPGALEALKQEHDHHHHHGHDHDHCDAGDHETHVGPVAVSPALRRSQA
ncbi:nitrile hydratase accessory protein [Rhizobium sp.]|uniref:nitrile hydratase accessory protein n=1 Tax=Rhizobium sp. TaxID=391 RepID=UPI0034C614E0